MFTAVHTLVYADDPEAARAFFRDVLEWPCVDTGGGWLIFGSGPSELGVHPTAEGDWSTQQQLSFSLACDDIAGTVATLSERGVIFLREVRDDGWGLTTELQIPGGPVLMIYQPAHPLPALTLGAP